MSSAGVYRSDPPGHLFIVQTDPLKILCIKCDEIMDVSQHHGADDIRLSLNEFREKHGALGERLADHIGELLPIEP